MDGRMDGRTDPLIEVLRSTSKTKTKTAQIADALRTNCPMIDDLADLTYLTDPTDKQSHSKRLYFSRVKPKFNA